jgi:hypothetical protein
MLTQGKSFNARPNTRPLGQVLDDQRDFIKTGHPVLRQTADRLPQSPFRTRATWTKYRPTRAFWIGVLIGLLLVGFVFTMT